MQGEFKFNDRRIVLHGEYYYLDGWVRFECDVEDLQEGIVCNVELIDASLDITDENGDFATGEAESKILDLVEEIIEDEYDGEVYLDEDDEEPEDYRLNRGM